MVSGYLDARFGSGRGRNGLSFGGGGGIWEVLWGGKPGFHTVVFCVVIRVLDCVSPADGGGVVVGVAFVGGEVDFFEEFCFVVLEAADCVG